MVIANQAMLVMVMQDAARVIFVPQIQQTIVILMPIAMQFTQEPSLARYAIHSNILRHLLNI